MSTFRRSAIGLGIFASLAILCSFVIVTTLQSPVRGKTATYSAIFSDVSGLYVGNDVRISGIQVGKVTEIYVEDKVAVVVFTALKDDTIFQNTSAAIRYQNLVGQRYLNLELASIPADVLPEHGQIPLERTIPSFDISKLFNGFKPIFENIDPKQVNLFSENLLKLVQGDGSGLTSVLSDIDKISTTTINKQEIMAILIRNLGEISKQIGGKGNQISRFISELDNLLERFTNEIDLFRDSFDRINPVLGPIMDILDQGQEIYDSRYESYYPLFLQETQKIPEIVGIISLVPTLINSIDMAIDKTNGQVFSCSHGEIRLPGIGVVSLHAQGLTICQ
ncbi:MAG: MlaD family protein [Mycobacteriaceae bacterium]